MGGTVGRPNIVVISVDSMRADHLTCYGYPRATSPYMDALAGEGVLCERMLCPGIPTFPSYTTLYTGQHPLTHGIVAHPCQNELDKEAPFLPSLLLHAGYNTCAVDSLMRSRLWFGRGYEYYIDPSLRHVMLHLAVTCEELNDRALSWVRDHADAPFFLFMHYWDTHWPYKAPDRFRSLFYEEGRNPTDPSDRRLEPWWKHPLGMAARDTWLRTADGRITDPEYITALYDQEVRYADAGVGEFVAALDTMGLGDNTLVVVTADHGESMTEHGIFFDHHGLYDCTLHVPLIARWPARLPRGLRLPPMLQVSDIAPTLLEAAGVPVPKTMEGRSFLPLLTGQETAGGHDRVISLECYWQAKWSLRTKRHKFILARGPDLYGNPPRELYDLEADPREERNIAAKQPDVAAAMEAELEGWIAERLQALGLGEDPVRAHVTLGHPAG